MPYILISQQQIRGIHAQLEAVTGQSFNFKTVQNDETTLLCTWQNETHVDYILHVMACRNYYYQTALAVQRHREIETLFDRCLAQNEARRFFSDPRQVVRYMTGQIRG